MIIIPEQSNTMTVSGERRLERSSSTSSSRHHRQPHSRYGYSELTPILIFDKVAKSTVSQVTENGWDVTTYQYQSGGFSQVTDQLLVKSSHCFEVKININLSEDFSFFGPL